jgi:hypothetical protein
MLWFFVGPLLLIVVWLGSILYLRRFSLWMIVGGVSFCVVLLVLWMVLTSAAGPAASWQGTTAADRAGGRGFEADAAFFVFANGCFAAGCCLVLSLVTLVGVGSQAIVHRFGPPAA